MPSIVDLSKNPRPPGVRKLRGEDRAWRLRTGPLRAVYNILDDQQMVVVLKVARRIETTYRR